MMGHISVSGLSCVLPIGENLFFDISFTVSPSEHVDSSVSTAWASRPSCASVPASSLSRRHPHTFRPPRQPGGVRFPR